MDIGWVNLLESSTVTVTSAETLYPSTRLYDRLFGRNWVATTNDAQTIHCDQGSGGTQAVDTLVLPGGHNLSGCSMVFQYSDNDSDWSDAVTGWTQSDDDIIVKQASSSSIHRYWRVVITPASASDAPYCAEVFITLLYVFPGLAYTMNPTKSKDQVSVRLTSYSGVPHYVKQGESRYRWVGGLILRSTTEINNFDSFLDGWDGYKHFYVKDSEGNQFFAEFMEEPEISPIDSYKSSVRISLREVG